MRRDERIALIVGYVLVVAVLAVIGLGVAVTLHDEPTSSAPRRALSLTTVTMTYDADSQYVGACGLVTPPAPDACDAVNGTLRYSALYAFETAANYRAWVKANPGEVSRLASIMAAPRCSSAPTGLPVVMRTGYGQGLALVMSAVACAKHPEPITWPQLPPAPDPNRTDKQPPSPPGPITATPSG